MRSLDFLKECILLSIIIWNVYDTHVDATYKLQSSPSSGPSEGGTPVLITGSNFTDGRFLSCIFGGSTVPARIISLTEIECLSPPSQTIAAVTLKVHSNNMDENKSSLIFRYFRNPKISFAGPLHGPVTGGTAVILVVDSYIELVESVMCMFGTMIVTGSLINNKTVSCESPPLTTNTTVPVSVSLNGVDFSIRVSDPFVYRSPFVVHSISPTSGSVRGGTMVKVRGSGFVKHGLLCWFGDDLWSVAEYISDGEILCSTPNSMVEGIFTFSVRSEDDRLSSFSNSFFCFVADIHLSSLHPLSGPSEGGTPVLITGSNFTDGRFLSCIFGGSTVPARIISLTEIECLSPPSQTIAAVTLKVHSNNMDENKSSLIFRYFRNPKISFAGPLHGPVTGGTAVILVVDSYIELVESVMCMFGTMIVTGSLINNKTVSCESPPLTTNTTVPVSVSLNGVDFSIRVSDPFVYRSPFVVHSISPTSGSVRGGTMVKVRGSGFVKHGLLCWFGDDLWSVAEYISDGEINCRAPKSSSQLSVLFTVALEDERFPRFHPTDYVVFQYVSDAESRGNLSESKSLIDRSPIDVLISSIQPDSGTVLGGTRVIVRGHGLNKFERYLCMFGGTLVPSFSIGDGSSIACYSPSYNLTIAVYFQLCRDDLHCFGDLLYKYNKLEIRWIQPNHGFISGGGLVSIGTNIPLGENSLCRFGDKLTKVFSDGGLNPWCETPSYLEIDQNLTIPFAISYDGLVFLEETLDFTYIPLLKIIDIDPPRIMRHVKSALIVNVDNILGSHDVDCVFRQTIRTRSSLLSETSLRCQCPILSDGDVDFYLAQGQVKISNKIFFQVLPPPRVSEISPQAGPPGTKVKLFGDYHLMPMAIFCHFGSHVIHAAQYESSTVIECVSPSDPVAQAVPLRLSYDGYESLVSVNYTFFPKPQVESLWPLYVDVSRKEFVVNIAGRGLHLYEQSGTSCRIGNFSSAEIRSTPSGLRCSFTGVLPRGYYHLIISSTVYPSIASPKLVSLLPSPILLSCYSSWDDDCLCEKIYIHGYDFEDANFTCFFDGKAHRPIFVTGSANAVCVVPNHLSRIYELRVSNDGYTMSSNYLMQRPLSMVSAKSFEPTKSLGETLIFVSGQNFDSEMKFNCLFGYNTTTATGATVYNSTILLCPSPSRFYPGTHNVSFNVLFNGRKIFSRTDLFFTFVDTSLLSLSPSYGFLEGGTEISITLTVGVAPGLISHCRFGRKSHRVLFMTGCIEDGSLCMQVVCISPPSPDPDVVPVSLSSNGQDSAISSLVFEYVERPIVTSIDPSVGYDTGGTTVSIKGVGFSYRAQYVCRFGNITVAATQRSRHLLQCVIPPMRPDTYKLYLSVDGVDFAEINPTFEIRTSVTLSYNYPTSGTSQGGNIVSIYGRGFRFSDNIHCYFDELQVMSIFRYEHEVLCATPPRKSGPCSIKIRVNGILALSSNPLVYYFHETIHFYGTGVVSGTYQGGTTLLISSYEHLTDFSIPYECIFEDYAVPAVVMGPSALSCRSPPGIAGASVSISIRLQSELFPVKNCAFHYHGDLAITGIDPPLMTEFDNQSVFVSGGIFIPGRRHCCLFGTDHIVDASDVSSSSLNCPVPVILLPNKYNLSVSIDCEQFSSSVSFRLTSRSEIYSISPLNALSEGTSMLSISGSNFLFFVGLQCQFNGTTATGATVYNSTILLCPSPPRFYPGTHNVSFNVLFNGRKIFSRTDLFFTFVDTSLLSLSPSYGFLEGGTEISITLTVGVAPGLISHCRFGRKSRRVLFMTGCIEDGSLCMQVVCISPPSPDPDVVPVSLSSNGQDSAISSLVFEYVERPIVTSIDPSVGYDTGGTTVSIKGVGFSYRAQYVCRFGNITVAATQRSRHLLQCSSPPLYPGTHMLRLAIATSVDWQPNREESRFPFIVYSALSFQEAIILSDQLILVSGSPLRWSPLILCRTGNTVVKCSLIDKSQLSCPRLALSVSGGYLHNISLSLHGDEFTPLMPLKLRVAGIIERLDPPYGPEHGGSLVTFVGECCEGFSDVLCRFGGYVVHAESTYPVICKVPPKARNETSVVPVSVSVDGGHMWSNIVYFHYKFQFKVMSVEPKEGLCSGGNWVAIQYESSSGNQNPLWCMFGLQVSTNNHRISDSYMACTAPAHIAGKVELSVTDGNTTYMVSHYDYLAEPTITNVRPASGSYVGGTKIIIEGLRFIFADQVFCYFDGEDVPATVKDESTIECSTPPRIRGSLVSVEIGNFLHRYPWNWGKFIYTEMIGSDESVTKRNLNMEMIPSISNSGSSSAPRVLSVWPLACVLDAEVQVIIEGSGFIDKIRYYCQFGYNGTTIIAKTISPNILACRSPSVDRPKTLPILLRPENLPPSFTGFDFIFHHSCSIISVELDGGSSRTGTSIIIHGKNFVNSGLLVCIVDSNIYPALIIDQTKVKCMISHTLRGYVNISLSSDNLYGATCGNMISIYFQPPPIIISIAPGNAPLGTPVRISITGGDFVNVDPLLCNIGNMTVNAYFRSDTTIECETVQLDDLGDFPVQLSIDKYTSNALSFQSVPRVTLLSVHPSIILANRKTFLTVRGAFFLNTLRWNCAFDQNQFTAARWLSPEAIECSSPIFSVKNRSIANTMISVHASNGSNFMTMEYKLGIFYNDDVVTSMTPSSGWTIGGSEIYITVQRNSLFPKYCLFGTVSVMALRGSDPMTVRCRAPSHPGGVVKVQLITELYVLDAGLYYFYTLPQNSKIIAAHTAEPRVYFTQPSIVPDLGGSVVFVYGEGFVDSTKLMCRFGSEEMVAHFISNTQLACKSPVNISQELLAFDVTLDNIAYSRSVTLQVYSIPIVERIEPIYGFSNGRSTITISLRNLKISTGLKCRFGPYEVLAVLESKASITCQTPDVYLLGSMFLSLSFNGVDYHATNVTFTFLAPLKIESYHPRQGFKHGTTRIVATISTVDPRCGVPICWFGTSLSIKSHQLDHSRFVCETPLAKGGVSEERIYMLCDGLSPQENDQYLPFNYVDETAIYEVAPPIGSVIGGTPVIVKVSEIPVGTHHLRCAFGRVLVPVVYASENEVTCLSPPLGTEYQVPLNIMSDDELVAANIIAASFRYMPHPHIYEIFPDMGSTSGGTNVHIYGDSFDDSFPHLTFCRFDYVHLVQASVINSEEIVCRSPAVEYTDRIESTVNISVTFNGVDFIGDTSFKYSPPLRISAVSPAYGPKQGGAFVNVTVLCADSSLVSNAMCHFGPWTVIPHEIIRDRVSFSVSCYSPDVSDSQVEKILLKVSVNGGNDMTESGSSFKFFQYPEVLRIIPTSGWIRGGNEITIEGSGFDPDFEFVCRFGRFRAPMVNWVSYNRLVCLTPHIELTSAMYTDTVQVSIVGMEAISPPSHHLFHYFHHPSIVDVKTFKVNAKDKMEVHISGKFLSSAIGCVLGTIDDLSNATIHSDNRITCVDFPDELSLVRPAYSSVRLYVLFQAGLVDSGFTIKQEREEFFNHSFHSNTSIRPIIEDISPLRGTPGQYITIRGDNFVPGEGLACLFGDSIVTEARFISSSEITCKSPYIIPAHYLLNVRNGLSLLLSKRGHLYTLLQELYLISITPRYGSCQGGTRVEIQFLSDVHDEIDDRDIVCMFGSTKARGYVISAASVSCFAPASVEPHTVVIKLSTDRGSSFSISSLWFTYFRDPHIVRLLPSFSSIAGGSLIVAQGNHFIKSPTISCRFGDTVVRATFVTPTTVACTSPAWEKPEDVAFDVSINSVDFTNSGLVFQFILSEQNDYKPINNLLQVPIPLRSIPRKGFVNTPLFITGHGFKKEVGISCRFDDVEVIAFLISSTILYCRIPTMYTKTFVTLKVVSSNSKFVVRHESILFEIKNQCPQGYYCGFNHSFIRPSPNGTFTSSYNARNFTLCPPGSFAPKGGNTACLPCPVSYICPDYGLSKPVVCPAGYVCEKTGLISPLSPCPQGYFCRAGTKVRNPSHTVRNSVTLETPLPCPAGYYCKDGAKTNVSIPDDFSTPQPCYDGYFCPPGSSSPEGSGACPTGHFCDNFSKIPCPLGFYCPGVGNTSPKKCFPGSYTDSIGSSRCIVCPIGKMCPLSGMTAPHPCVAGMICDSSGLSIPEKPCPPGYICEEGTGTSDPIKAKESGLVAPVLCPSGYFCIGGIANRTPTGWPPEYDISTTSPLLCNDGYYCGEGSRTPSGSGVCFPGHYCPKGSGYPIPVPLGTFAESGSIAPTVCFPGSYAPTEGSIICRTCPAGSYCTGYGDYIPKSCEPGTYRSTADSISCKPCPTATFNPFTGATDISYCFPCPEGRICPTLGMFDMEQSIPCHSGFVCASLTDKNNQYDHPCPGGFFCDSGTSPSSQFHTPCDPGYMCNRGSQSTQKETKSCPSFHTCPKGTSSINYKVNQCPFQTSSIAGSAFLNNCTVYGVSVCDKNDTEVYDPTETLTYFELRGTDNSPNSYPVAVGKVIDKVFPMTKDKNQVSWDNDVVLVHRSCPRYFFDERSTRSRANVTYFTIIGRNFKPSTSILCRYHVPIEDTLPFVLSGTYMSSSRIKCPLPTSLTSVLSNRPSPDSCEIDGNGITYYKQRCLNSFDPQCIGSLILDGHRYKLYYEIVIPCTAEELANGICLNLPFQTMKFNPCFVSSITIDVSLDGGKFSGDPVYISLSTVSVRYTDYSNPFMIAPSNATVFFVQPQLSHSMDIIPSLRDEFNYLISDPYSAHTHVCMEGKWIEEGERSSELEWHFLPFMHMAHLSVDWRHIPVGMKYGVHFKLGIFVRPSRCFDIRCDRHRRTVFTEKEPCVNPIQLPRWFLDDRVDKHEKLNLTLLALDDVLFRVEVNILDGLYLATSPFFLNSLNWTISSPHRARMSHDKRSSAQRPVSPYISWSGVLTPTEYFFVTHLSSAHSNDFMLPLNMPPRWDSLKSGRVLLSMNASMESPVPSTVDNYTDINISDEYWMNPFVSAEAAKERTDLFRETFHGLSFIDGKYSYEMSDILLPYLPYFSNCREFDSYVMLSHLVESHSCSLPDVSAEFPGDWWRRKYSPLPHIDSIRSVGPFDYQVFYPIADWCERQLRCNYEEPLNEVNRRPRWFEAVDGDIIFNMIREPLSYSDFTGRDRPTPSPNDGGSQRYVKRNQLFELYIPVTVVTNIPDNIAGICGGRLCYPRKISLDISYYQIDQYQKRLVEVNVVYEHYDRDFTNIDYDLHIRFRPLNYRELLIKFAYNRHVFLLLFLTIGLSTVVISFFYWGIVLLTTKLRSPPKMRFLSMLYLILTPAGTGFVLAMIPIFLLTATSSIVIGSIQAVESSEKWSIASTIIFMKTSLRRMKNPSIDSLAIGSDGQGRLGVIFLCIGGICLFEGSKMLVPQESKRDTKVSLSSYIKRSNLILCSIFMSLGIALIVEWSYSNWFGDNIWEAIILMNLMNVIIGDLASALLGESLLCAPIMAALGIAQSVVTLSANDFVDFLLSYIVGYGLLVLERMYLSPFLVPLIKSLLTDVVQWSTTVLIKNSQFLCNKLLKNKHIHSRSPAIKEKSSVNYTTPIIDSYGDYCLDTLSLFYLPFVIFLLMVFRDETEIPERYSIKEHDLQQYLLFSIVIIPFQMLADVYIHYSLELFHGYKIHEYLTYCRYRFSQRQSIWKGVDYTKDKCIEKSRRSLDQTCFSSQFYMMVTIHVNGIIYLVIGIEIIARAQYNPFTDAASPIIVICVFVLAKLVKTMAIIFGTLLGIWRVDRRNSTWYKAFIDNFTTTFPEKANDKRTEEYQNLDQMLNSEAYRHKFLSMNRSWLISKLPELLSPQTIRRSRPILRNQFMQIQEKVNGNISSDDDSDAVRKNYDVSGLSLTPPARNMLSLWLERAKRKKMMRNLVQPLIEHAKADYCERCQSRRDLRVKLRLEYDELVNAFLVEQSADNPILDHVEWKQFWNQHQKYTTMCLACLSKENERNHKNNYHMSAENPFNTKRRHWGPVLLEDASKEIVKKWYTRAKDRTTLSASRTNNKMVISDDDEDDDLKTQIEAESDINLEPKTLKIASSWLTVARFNLLIGRNSEEAAVS